MAALEQKPAQARRAPAEPSPYRQQVAQDNPPRMSPQPQADGRLADFVLPKIPKALEHR